MFGIGFSEILLIAIVALLFLGPDKLPETMVSIAKFIRNIKQTLTDAKRTFEEEVHISHLKEEALSYKRELDKATEELRGFKNIELDEILDEPLSIEQSSSPSPYADARTSDAPSVSQEKAAEKVEPKMENVSLKKRERTFKTLDADDTREES